MLNYMENPSNIIREIKEILQSKLYNFKIRQNPELQFKSLLNEIEKLKIPFPLFQKKGYLIDLSFLNFENKKFNQLKDIIKEDKNNNDDGKTNDILLFKKQENDNVFGVFKEINLIDKEKKRKEEEEKEKEKEKERKIKEERKKEGEELFEHFLESINKKDDYLDIQLNINKIEEKELSIEKKKNEALNSVLGILEKTTGTKEDNRSIEEKKKESLIHILEQLQKPLDFINFIENNYDDIKEKKEKNIDLTPLNTYKMNHEIRIDALEISEKEKISNIIMNKNEKINQFFVDRAFKILYAASNKGIIYRYDLEKEKEEPSIKGNFGEILCMDNYEDLIIIGNNKGIMYIIIKENETESIIDEKQSAIISIKIVKYSLKKKNKEKIEYLYSNKAFQVNLIIRAKGIFNKKKCICILKNPSPIFDIISYNPDIDLSISKKKRMYFGFIGIQNLIFMKIRPHPQSLEELNKKTTNIVKPDGVDENNLPDCCLGLGYIPTNKPKNLRFSRDSSILDITKLHPLLLISWGKIIFLYYEKLDLDGYRKYKLNSIFVHTDPILRIVYLTNSCIAIIDCKYIVKLIYTYNFDTNIKNLKDPTIIQEDYIFNCIKLNPIKFNEFSYIKTDKNNNTNTFYRNIYCNYILPFQNENKGLIIFEENNIKILNLATYQKITNQLAENNKFEQMLWFGKIIFNNPKQALTLGNDSEGDFLNEYKNNLCVALFIKAYSAILRKNDEENMNLFIREIIEFSMDAECSTALFNFFDSVLQNETISNIIFEIYTKYMMEFKDSNNKLNEGITENFLLNYIDYYIKRNKKIELSKVLLKLDCTILKKEKIEQKIIENELINVYIYISMNLISDTPINSISNPEKEEYSNEYYKPIQFIYALFLSKTEISNQKYRDFIINQDVNVDLNEVFNCSEYYGHKLLWYCNYCFRQVLYPYGFLMDLQSFNLLVKKILIFLTSKDKMDLFLKFDSYSFFQVLSKLYLDENLFNIINTNFDNETLEDFMYSVGDEKNNCKDLSAKQILYDIIFYSKSKENIYINKDLYDFVALVSKNMIINEVVMDKIILKDACVFLLNYPNKRTNCIIEDPFNCHTPKDNKEFIKEKNSNQEKIKIIIDQAKNIDFDDNDIKQLLEISKLTPYYEITLLLLNLLKKFEESLEFQIDCKEFDKSEIFDWINHTLNEIKLLDKKSINGEDYEIKFKMKLLEKLKDLVKINRIKTSELIDIYFNDQQETVIQQFEGNPELQFQYIEKYLENYEKREIEHIDELKYFISKKIQLLVKLEHKGEVLKLLQKYNFVCNKNMLDFCYDNKLIDCYIYINYKIGNIEKGVDTVIDELKKNLDYILNNINNSINSKNRRKFIYWLIDKNNRYLDLGIEACKLISNNFVIMESFWEKILNGLYDMRNTFNNFVLVGESTIDKENDIKKINKMIEENIQNVLIAMSEYVTIPVLMDIVTMKCKNASMKEFSGIITQLFNSQRILEVICNSAKILIEHDVFKNIEKYYYIYHIKGRSFEPNKCNYCGRMIKNEKIVLFGCNHYYHVQCCAEEKNLYVCFICKKREIEESITYIENNMKLPIDKEIEYNEIQNENDIKNKKIEEEGNRKYNIEILKKMKKHHLILENAVNDMEIIDSGVKSKLKFIQIGN